MTDPTPATAGTIEIHIPSGQEVYDAIMGEIEPELLTANIPLLEEQHKGETPEEKAARSARYTEAYAQYDAAYKTWADNLQKAVAAVRKEALRSAEKKDKLNEDAQLLSLEAAMAQTATS